MKKTMGFRFCDETRECLDFLANERRTTRTAIIEMLVCAEALSILRPSRPDGPARPGLTTRFLSP